jgi:ectoine hydroxylase-related dioxygenase (phytanoyl-CoA dioxygenase family)
MRVDAQGLARWRERVDAVITEATVQAYAHDGAVCIRGLLNSDELALLKGAIEENRAHPSERAIVASRAQDPGKFFEDFCNWERIAGYRAFLQTAPLALVAQRLMKSVSVRFYHDHLLVKEPATQQPTPWHQDQPYYNIDGFQNVSMWIPVDPVPRESTLEFIGASHLGPWLMPRTFMTNEARWFEPGTLAELPQIEAQRHQFPILGWELEPGDFVCFHMLSLHAAAGSQGMRRVFSARFTGDDVRHAPRGWKTSPQFPGLERELPAGAPLDHPLFPLMIDA